MAMRCVLIAATLMVSACAQGPTGQATTSASLSPTPSSTAVAHFVAPEPSAAKLAAQQAAGDGAFSAFVAFHELGLRPGQSVAYKVTATASANYQCMSIGGTLNAATDSAQVATGQVSAERTLRADASGQVSAVITLRPPAPANPVCPPGYAIGAWRSSYAGITVADAENGVTWSGGDQTTQA